LSFKNFLGNFGKLRGLVIVQRFLGFEREMKIIN
jgi:hypothetical protein